MQRCRYVRKTMPASRNNFCCGRRKGIGGKLLKKFGASLLQGKSDRVYVDPSVGEREREKNDQEK